MADDLGFEPTTREPAAAPSDDLGFMPDQDLGFEPTQMPEPDMQPVKDFVKQNLQKHQEEKAAKAQVGSKQPEMADDFIEAIEAGLQISTAGLIARGGKPNMILPENAPSAHRIASQVATIAGDLPAMVVGGLVGGFAGATGGAVAAGAAGSVVPVAGTVAGIGVGSVAGGFVGGAGGSNALPTAIRETLMQSYEKGDIQDFSDFWERASAVFIETTKDFGIGVATMGAGKAVKAFAPISNEAIKGTAAVASEIATMTTMGAALDGQVPKAQDFVDAAIVVGGLHGAGRVTSRLRQYYGKDGLTPAEVAEHAAKEPVAKQELLVNRPEPIAETKIDVNQKGQTVFHGTNAPFEKLDYKKSGGMVFFAESKDKAQSYANDTGSGGRSSLKLEDVNVFDTSRSESEGPYTFKDGNWVQEKTGKTLTHDQVAADIQEGGSLTYVPKNARVIEQQVNPSKILDTNSEEGLRKLRGILQPTNKRIERFIREIDRELNKEPGAPGFGYEFWTTTKHSRSSEINAALTEFSEQVKKAGFEGIRFQDDSHPTVALFEKAADQPTPELKAARENIRSQIGEKGEAPKKKTTFNEVYKDWADRFDPIKTERDKLVPTEKIKESQDPYILARESVDHGSKTKVFLVDHTFDFNDPTKKTGVGLKKILEPVKDLKEFEDFVTARRALELESQGRKSGMDKAAAEVVVKELDPKYGKIAKEFTEWQNRTLEYLADSGVLSKEALNTIKERNKDYVPFQRLAEDGQKAGDKSSKKPIKELKGSDKKVIEPIKTAIENTEFLIKLAEVNRPKLAFVELAEKTPNQTVIEKVPTQLKPEEVVKELRKQGIEIDPADVEAFNVFRKASRPLAPDEFEIFRDGKIEVYKTTDPFLAESLNRIGNSPGVQGLVFKLMSTITSVKKIGITSMWDFIAKNLMRDIPTAGVFGVERTGITDVLSAMGGLITKPDIYWEWQKSGGGNGSFIQLNERYLKQNIFSLSQETGLQSRAWNVLTKVEDMYHLTSTLAEQSLRFAQFKKVYEKNGGSKDALFKAGMASREVTLDFARMGAKMQSVNAIVAFTNVSLQGLDRTARAFKENPQQMATRAATFITVPSIMLWWANKDDERVKDLPRWEKDLNWIIATDDWQPVKDINETSGLPPHLIRETENGIEINRGIIYKIPKPQELGILFGSLPERLMDQFFTDNPEMMKDFEKTMLDLLMPNLIPDAIAPIAEQAVNRSFFTQNDIVPHNLQGLMPEHRYTPRTSETAKVLGQFIGHMPYIGDFGPDEAPLSSPVVVENYIQNWSGSAGKYALQAIDAALIKSGVVPDPVKPVSTLADIPFVKSFIVRYPHGNLTPVRDFYERFEKHQQYQNSLMMLAKSGDVDAWEKLYNDPTKQKYQVPLEGVKDAMGNMNSMIQKILQSKDMSPEEKRDNIDSAYFMMLEMAKQGNMMIRESEKALKENAGGN
jgi:hypothetical protein